MKNLKIFLIGIFILFFNGCLKESYDNDLYSNYKPVLIDNSSLYTCLYKPAQNNKIITQVRTMGNYLFALDYGMGIHVIDNTNPTIPVKLGFYSIPACIDFEIQNNKIFANNYRDFIVLDFSNINSPIEVKREKSAFDINVKAPDGAAVFPKLMNIPQNTTIISYENL